MLISSFILGLVSSQNIIADTLDKANTVIDGVNKLNQLVLNKESMDAKGISKRESIPLNAPRIDYGITPDDVRSYIKHTGISRCSPSQVMKGICSCEEKFDQVRVYRNETFDSHSGVAVDGRNKLIVIAYRDTLSETNWLSNFKSSLVSHPFIQGQQKIHDGHLEYVSSLFYQMEPTIVELLTNHPTFKLHITGYSLGGSAAIISLPFWANTIKTNNLTNKIQVFTYAAPRPGNLAFAEYVESLAVPVVRYTQRGDVVSHAPDQSMGYSHSGLEFYDSSIPLWRKSIVRCSLDVMEDPDCMLKDKRFHATIHLAPFQRPAPLPPIC